MPNDKEWKLDREWAEEQATEEYRAHLRDRLRSMRRRLEAAASSSTIEQVRYVGGQIAALREILKETTAEEAGDDKC